MRFWTASTEIHFGIVGKAPVTTHRTCYCVLPTCKNVGNIEESVRGEYGLRTDFWSKQRRHSIFCECKTSSAWELRACYGFTTSTCDVRVPYVQACAPTSTRATRTASACLLKKIPLSIVLHATHIISTLSERSPCLARADSVCLHFKCPKTFRHVRKTSSRNMGEPTISCVGLLVAPLSPVTIQENKTSFSCRVTASCPCSSRFCNICGARIAISKQRQIWFPLNINGSL